ncbi:MAG: hypothetical protein HYY30_09430 [Chloroflexi bacterium]|nr:hypothetical protein [Chloroflexota bacterium]
MPAKLGTLNAVNVVFFLPSDAPWRERLRAALLASTDPTDLAAVERHLAVLDERWAGALDWTVELAPKPARSYSEMLLAGGRLPLYRHGPIRFTVDLFNPGNEAKDPTYDPRFLTVELLVHRHEIYPWDKGVLPDGTKIDYSNPEQYGRQVVYGEALGDLTARWAEILEPTFACADMQYLGSRLRTATSPTSVVNPSPAGINYWDYLWSLSYWSPSLLDDKLASHLRRLSFTPQQVAKFDRFWGRGICPTWRQLSTGGLLVQYRFIFAEHRNSRSAVDTPLARQAGLRTTNIVYRS